MLKGLVAGVLLASSVYAQDISKDSSYAKELSRLSIPLSYAQHLVVNKENINRKISFLSELDGINDARELGDSTGYEESWIFDPKNNMWFETGREESGWIVDSLGYYTHLSLDSLYVDQLMDSLDALVAYHDHPSYGYPFITDSSTLPKDMKKVLDKFGVEAFAYPLTAIPSVQDINTMILEQSKFYRKKPYGKINHCVVSHLGITEYDLTNKAKKFILEEGGNIVMVPNFDNLMTSLSLYFRTLSSFSKDTVIDLEETCINNITDIISFRTNEFIDMKFYPYRSLLMKNKNDGE